MYITPAGRDRSVCVKKCFPALFPKLVRIRCILSAINKKAHHNWWAFLFMAERMGFEPTIPFGIHTFQACSFNHSDTSLKLIYLTAA